MARPDPFVRHAIKSTTAMRTLNPCREVLGVLGGLVAAMLVQGAQAGTLEAINHTHWAINRFSVDGRSGIDIIGPYQGGGGGLLFQRSVALETGDDGAR